MKKTVTVMAFFFLSLNVAVAIFDLKTHHVSDVGLIWFGVGLAGLAAFVASLLERLARGEVTPRLAGDLILRAMLGSLGILFAFGWMK